MRGVLYKLHLWSGLVIGLLLMALGISGSLLVFRADLERLQHGEGRQVEPRGAHAPIDSWIAAALAAVPNKVLARVTLPATEREVAQVFLQIQGARNLKQAELEAVYVDPYRVQVLGSYVADRGWIWAMQDFHYALFSGETGLKVNGVAAILLVVLALSGPLLWWPGWTRVGIGLRVRTQSPRAFWRDLHAVSGVVSCLALLLIGLTGTYYAYRSTATAAVTLLSGNAALPPPVAATPGGRALPLQALLDAMRRHVPRATLDEVRPARSPRAAASISFRWPGERVFARNRAFLDPASAEILRLDSYRDLPNGAKVLANMQPWHFGSFAGRWSQWLWVFMGLLPALLFGSGLWLWWRKRRVAQESLASQ
jgi:uncharacterized iron-regulated membrane protein